MNTKGHESEPGRKGTQRAQRERSGSFFEVFEFFAAKPFQASGLGSRVHTLFLRAWRDSAGFGATGQAKVDGQRRLGRVLP